MNPGLLRCRQILYLRLVMVWEMGTTSVFPGQATGALGLVF